MRSVPKKRSVIMTVEKDKGAKASNSKNASYGRMNTRQYLVLPLFLYGRKNAKELLEQWVKDCVSRLPEMEFLQKVLSISEKKGPHTRAVHYFEKNPCLEA